jgi:hypothetical protein
MSLQVPKWVIEFARSPAAQKAGRRGIATFQRAWKNRGKYAAVAKKAKSYKKLLLEQTGEPVTSAPSKQTRLRSNGYQQYASNTLYFVELLQIDRQDHSSTY